MRLGTCIYHYLIGQSDLQGEQSDLGAFTPPLTHKPLLLQCAKAVWPIFQKQKFGRIVTMGSQAGICKP